MKRRKFIIAFFALTIIFSSLFGFNVIAQEEAEETPAVTATESGATVYVPQTDIIQNVSLTQLIVDVLNVVLGFLGFVAVIIILIGGFKWMTSAGDSGKVGSAKSTISAGIIGLVIILASWGIANFVFSLFNIETSGTTTGEELLDS